ncbi:hypothetical protein BBJ28_00013776 [Nothophytophthora sp. Chile5]|nr:hypothetical protein BBJ28_00013776 [Nothophytophthora sp. Chile5]
MALSSVLVQELPTGFNAFATAAAAKATGNKADEDAKAADRRRVGLEAARSLQQSQVERTRAQALADDPSVFDYDAVYDDMKSARQSEVTKRAVQREAEKKQPKYIGTLLAQAKIREVENERIRERRLLHERKADDALYGDKEKLVSASYKRKLQEMKRWDEEDARLANLEDRDDVTKQGEHAMAGFYANLNKNIAMGGSTANARSAYTAKEEPQDGDRKESTTGDADEHSTAKSDPEPVAKKTRTSDQGQRSPAREVEAHEFDAEKAEMAVQAPENPEEEPKPSKEDAIAAARARFLARKTQRKTAS